MLWVPLFIIHFRLPPQIVLQLFNFLRKIASVAYFQNYISVSILRKSHAFENLPSEGLAGFTNFFQVLAEITLWCACIRKIKFCLENPCF